MKLKFLLSITLTLISICIYGQNEVLLNASNSIKVDELKEKSISEWWRIQPVINMTVDAKK